MKKSQIKLDYDVCGRCGVLFDDQGENGWWIEDGLWWHECNEDQPARIVVRKLARAYSLQSVELRLTPDAT